LSKVNHAEVYGNFIGGSWRHSGQTFPVTNKYTGEVLAQVASASEADVSAAVGTALSTFQAKPLPVVERCEILLQAARLIGLSKERLATMIVRESGKVMKDALAEVDRAVQTFIASAEEAKRLAGKEIPLRGQPGNEHRIAFTMYSPVGVVCAITPFNFPLNLVAHKVAPAIAAGNSVVLKPAEAAPMTSMLLAGILQEAGLPNGFLNVVNGAGAEVGGYLLKDERIALFTFTGSPEVGRRIKNQTGIRKVVLELGNNSPNIVHVDAPDLAQAAKLCVARGFGNNGQACISVQRVYVHREIYDAFVRYAVEETKLLQAGDPESMQTDVGPMISIGAAERAESWIREAVNEGAEVAVGGTRSGALLQPTILVNATEGMKAVCEEIFAPVISIIAYDDFDQALKLANDSRYGLQAGVFTSNLQLAMKAARTLEFGGVIINDASSFRADIMPYGGFKDSGFGKEGPAYAVREMSEERIIVINL